MLPKKFHSFADFLIQYLLFYNQPNLLQNVLDKSKLNYIEGINQLIASLDDLCFYGVTDPLLGLCRSVYQPAATSSKLIGDPESEFGSIIITVLSEQVYRQLQ